VQPKPKKKEKEEWVGGGDLNRCLGRILGKGKRIRKMGRTGQVNSVARDVQASLFIINRGKKQIEIRKIREKRKLVKKRKVTTRKQRRSRGGVPGSNPRIGSLKGV